MRAVRPASSSYDRRTLRSAFSVDTGQHTGYIFRSIVCRSRAFIFGHLFGDSFAHLFGQPAARGTSGLKSLNGRGKRKRVCVRESPHDRSALATGTRCGIARLIACRTLGPPEE